MIIILIYIYKERERINIIKIFFDVILYLLTCLTAKFSKDFKVNRLTFKLLTKKTFRK